MGSESRRMQAQVSFLVSPRQRAVLDDLAAAAGAATAQEYVRGVLTRTYGSGGTGVQLDTPPPRRITARADVETIQRAIEACIKAGSPLNDHAALFNATGESRRAEAVAALQAVVALRDEVRSILGSAIDPAHSTGRRVNRRGEFAADAGGDDWDDAK